MQKVVRRWHEFGLCTWLLICYSLSSAYVKMCYWQQQQQHTHTHTQKKNKKKQLQPAQDSQLEWTPRTVSSPDQFPSGIASLFFRQHLLFKLAAATVSMWLGPEKGSQNTLEVWEISLPPEGWHETMIQKKKIYKASYDTMYATKKKKLFKNGLKKLSDFSVITFQ